MRPYCTLLLVILVVFLGGALLAPWLYWLVTRLAPASSLARKPFHRYLSRSLLGLGLLAIWPLLLSLQARSWRDAGLCEPSGQWGRLAGGVLLGAGLMACLSAVVLAVRARRMDTRFSAGKLAVSISGKLAAAVVIAVLEEILFRGAVFGALRRGGSWPLALIISGAFFALVHFLARSSLTGPVRWFSGLELLPQILHNFARVKIVIPGFFNLTLVGMILGLAYQCTGNLYLSIGLHAGCVFWMKFYGLVTIPAAGGNTWLWGTEQLIDGWLALPVLLLVLLVLLVLPRLAAPGVDSALL
jgi:membrane protease YdiL (CAAX protease family)